MLKRLWHAWRVLATGLSFVIFGLGGLACSLVLVLPMYILPPAWRVRAVQRLVHYTFRLFIWIMRAMGVCTWQWQNLEALQQARGTLIIANHPSLLDVVFLIAFIPETYCIVKHALWRNPFVRGLVQGAGYISNSDPIQLIQDCSAVLQQGGNLLVFPEGTRSTPGAALHFQRGAANIALHSDASVLPVTIICDPPSLLKGQKWYDVPPRRMHFSLSTGSRFRASTLVNQEDPAPRKVREINTRFHTYFSEELYGDVGQTRT